MGFYTSQPTGQAWVEFINKLLAITVMGEVKCPRCWAKDYEIINNIQMFGFHCNNCTLKIFQRTNVWHMGKRYGKIR